MVGTTIASYSDLINAHNFYFNDQRINDGPRLSSFAYLFHPTATFGGILHSSLDVMH